MANNDYDEKRDFVRMNIDTQITYKIKGGDGQSYTGISENLSATGLSMDTSYQLSKGDEIELIMNPSGDKLPPFVAEGTVLRIEEKSTDKFHASISLTKTL